MPALLLMLSCLAPASADAESRTVVVGVYENAPKVFTSESGRPSGIFIDIIEQIAKTEGWRLRYLRGTWEQGLDRLAKGEIDLMPDVAYTAEREKLYSFHKTPVLTVWSQLYAKKGSGIQSILDLNRKRVAALDRTIQLETLKRLTNSFGLDITLIPVPDYQTEFQMVAAGKADAGLTNRLYGLMYARKFGLEDTPVMFDPAPYFFAASLDTADNGSARLLAAIDRQLAAMKNDRRSAYYQTLNRWTSEQVQFKLPSWLKMAGVATAVMLFMSLVGSFVLKHQVNARTRELKQVNQEMERRIEERTLSLQESNVKLKHTLEDLAVAKERAEEADRLKSAFLATMSHELRTPLNSIIGFTGILRQGLAGPLNDEQIKQLGMVATSANHLLALINDVLDLSKIEAGQMNVASEKFDLRAAVLKAIQTVRPLAEKKGLRLQAEIDDKVGTVTSDQRRVEQILLNILSNAVKFTENGEVSLFCRIGTGCVVTTVTDTGIGIAAGDLTKLFLPFHQVESGLTRQYDGTGLGLSICQRLVELLGGTIRAESEPGVGSRFSFTLPLEPTC